jgi:hypothetical protein
MLAYYTMFASLLCVRVIRTKSMFIYYVFLAALTLFVGLRYRVGCDWGGYLLNFMNFHGGIDDAIRKTEPAHWAVISILHSYHLSYTYLGLVTSIIFFGGLSAIAVRQPNPIAVLTLAFPVLIVNMPMSAVRQSEAIGFICLAFNAFVDKRLIRYIGWVFCACCFHSSAIVFMVLAPLVKSEFSRRTLMISALLAGPGIYMIYRSSVGAEAVARYVGTHLDAAGAIFRAGLLLAAGLFYLTMASKPWRLAFPNDYKLMMIGAWMMLVPFGLVGISTVIADRFGYYLMPLQIVMFARIPYLPGICKNAVYRWFPYAILTATFVIWTNSSVLFKRCYTPYQIGIVQSSQ